MSLRHSTSIALLLASLSGLLQDSVPATETPERLRLAAEAFAQARAACDEDNAKLWGKQLWGPVMLVDPATRRFVANEAIEQSDIAVGVTPTVPVNVKGRTVHVGTLPENLSAANTASEYAGRRWAMVVWPIADTPQVQRQLLVHELWHRIQSELGLPLDTPTCDHLDTEEGRLWLRLEMRALATALAADAGPGRLRAIEDALAFRSHRRSLFDGAGESERKLELAEGLAEYTG